MMTDQVHDGEAPDGPGGQVVPIRPGAGDPAPADVSYEVEIDDAGDAPAVPQPVDPPAAAVTLLPVIPGHLRTRAGIRAAAARQGRLARHHAAYHGVRSPIYLARAVGYAAVGALALAWHQIAWAFVMEQHALRTDAAADGAVNDYLKLHKAGAEARKVRLLVLGAEVIALAVGVILLVRVAPWWGQALAMLAALPLLALAGRPADRRIVSQATVTPRFRKLSADIVLRAYYAAGLGHPEKPDQQVTFGGPMSRDGDGSRVLVDLPYGRTLTHAMNAREEIASGLDVQVSQVFIHRDPTSTRRHALWVADRDPLAVTSGRTPLLACRPTDVWRPAQLGLDERGQVVDLTLMWTSVLVGALPRQGKSFFARLLALFVALDPWVKLDVFDPSGKPDWRKFALVADSCAFGLTPTRRGLPPEILLATLERIKDDVQDRYNRLSALPTTICPEGKLTRQIARDPDMGMPVRALVLDEFQEFFGLGDISRQIAELLVFLSKVAPAAGVILIDATQKPSGIGGGGQLGNLFNAFRDNHQVRFSLRTSSYSVSEAVLGQGAYGEGLDSSTLLPQYKGVGILRGATDANPTVRTYLADADDAARILGAARLLRQQAGTLTGTARNQEEPEEVVSIAEDILAVWTGPATPGIHWDALAGMLATRFPARYRDATKDSVSATARGAGIPSEQVKYLGRNAQGAKRPAVEAAARKIREQAR